MADTPTEQLIADLNSLQLKIQKRLGGALSVNPGDGESRGQFTYFVSLQAARQISMI